MKTKSARNIMRLGLKYWPFQFTTRARALRFAKSAVTPHAVIIGDNGQFWVVCKADFERLLQAGYEAA